jgi:hypothetical protein
MQQCLALAWAALAVAWLAMFPDLSDVPGDCPPSRNLSRIVADTPIGVPK